MMLEIQIVQKEHSIIIYGAHFYVSMKDRAILGLPLVSHKLTNIYAFPIEAIWGWAVEPLRSNGQKNDCCKGGSHCLMWRAVAFFGSIRKGEV